MSEESVLIRQYKDSDYPAVKELYLEGDLYSEEIDSRERLKSKSEKDPESLIIAESEGKVVGSVSTIDDERFAFIFRLVVSKKYQKKGIGKKLVSAAEELLKKRKYEMIYMLVNDNDEGLLNYYEKQGYKRGQNPHRFMWKKTLKS
ncbi:hypothetical protein A3G67_01455 [Candidatus Roizmanbacteria bacterium RIFCSPLOWO2_12_FULL_40_12]|nr:MAG: hypothetical protein A3H84_02940 [Candidatus Roizmanbacteria bacterium RIFCSPLOWO2_02_FULL_40_13]OGK61155.1 MAG: hypothetical protein A3G67_01455 [Candidatus Roizmanbacteria bacterium RIFCSPLOWO2_12_FULL_40_12]